MNGVTDEVDETNNSDFDEYQDDEETTFSVDDKIAMEIVGPTLKRVNHKFQVALAFRHININLPDKFKQVHARLLSHKRHLLSHPNLIPK